MFETIFHCGAQGYAGVYARRLLALWQSNESIDSARWGSNPLRTCQVLLSRVRIPPYAEKHIASGLVTAGNGKDETVCESTQERFAHAITQLKAAKRFALLPKQCIIGSARKQIPWIKRAGQKLSFRLHARPLKYSAALAARVIAIAFSPLGGFT